MIFALIFADSHTQTLFKKLGSLFDLPQIPDIVVHITGGNNASWKCAFLTKKNSSNYDGSSCLKRKRFTVKKVDASHYLTNAWSSQFFCFFDMRGVLGKTVFIDR